MFTINLVGKRIRKARRAKEQMETMLMMKVMVKQQFDIALNILLYVL